MANRTLRDLPVTTSPAAADLLHNSQGTTDKSITMSLLAQYTMVDSDNAPQVVTVTGTTHTISTTVAKQLIICTISSNCTMTFPGSYGDAQEIIIVNDSSSTANVIGLPTSEILYPGQEIVFIWDSSAWIKRTFINDNQTGTAVPTTTPDFEGQKFIDTTNDEAYVAIGTSSSDDWKRATFIPKGYIKTELTVSGSNLIIEMPEIRIGNIVETKTSDTTIDLTTLTASTWYALTIREDTGTISAQTIATFGTSGGGSRNWDDTNFATNQLDMYTSLWDTDYKYCRANDGTNWFRVFGVFKTNSTPDDIEQIMGYDLLFYIPALPLTDFFTYRNANQSTSGQTKVQWDTIVYDINSELEITTNYRWQAKFRHDVVINASLSEATTSLVINALRLLVIQENGTNDITYSAWNRTSSNAAIFTAASKVVNASSSSYYEILITCDNKTILGGVQNNFIGKGIKQ